MPPSFGLLQDRIINFGVYSLIVVDPLQSVVSTGCSSLDTLLGGGFPIGGTTLIYGPAETGKTSLAIQTAVTMARMGKKVIFIDSDCTFFPKRLLQIAYYDINKVSPLIVLVRPKSFQEQSIAIDRLKEYLTKRVKLIIVDTVTSLYRVELGGPRGTFALNRELNRQIACLAEIAKTHEVATIMISQVHGVLERGQVSVEPVATRVQRFWSDIVLSLKRVAKKQVIKLVLEKHFNHKSPEICYLAIGETGICHFDQKS